MTSSYQDYYQYNQNFAYQQESYTQAPQYQEQPPPQYPAPTYDQTNQYQSYSQNNDFSTTGSYSTGYTPNNAQYPQYNTQNANSNQFAQTPRDYGAQYVSNGSQENVSYGQGYAPSNFTGNNNGTFSPTAQNYNTVSQPTVTKDFNQNTTAIYGQRPTDSAYVTSQTSGYNESGFGQQTTYAPPANSYQIPNNINTTSNSSYSQHGQKPVNEYGQSEAGQFVNNAQFSGGQFGQNKVNGLPGETHYNLNSQPPPPPPAQTVYRNTNSSNFPVSGERGNQSYDRSSRGSYQGRGSHSRGGRSHGGQSESRPFNGRGGRGGRYTHTYGSRGNHRGSEQNNTQVTEAQKKSENVLDKYEVRKRPLYQAGKENVPKQSKKEEEPVVAEEKQVAPESQPPVFVIPVAALIGLGESPSPEVEAKLRELMQPLYCRLCSVNLNAKSQAQQHYEGKNHSKKVRMFLASTSSSAMPTSDTNKTADATDTGADTEKTTEKPEIAPLDEEVYCKICDVSFTSVKQSTQHYQGKNHAKKVRLAAAANITTPSDTVVKGEGSQFECIMCSVHVTSQEQLNMHINGAKHKNKLRFQQRSSGSLGGRWVGDSSGHGEGTARGGFSGRGFKRPFGKGGNWSSSEDNSRNFQPKRPRQDFSNYRTPSGKFYCSCCNVTLNVESQFAQHVQSKRHKTNHAVRRNSGEHTDHN